jgi:hypothetical protein
METRMPSPTTCSYAPAGEFIPHAVQIGVAGEMIEWEGKWYRSGFFGGNRSYRLGFSEIEWQKGGAFRVVTPSRLAM